jgi:ankyrin repeat protein
MGISFKEGKEAALGQAAKCGDLSLVNYFLALNADPNIWDEHHIFPLHWAVQRVLSEKLDGSNKSS